MLLAYAPMARMHRSAAAPAAASLVVGTLKNGDRFVAAVGAGVNWGFGLVDRPLFLSAFIKDNSQMSSKWLHDYRRKRFASPR